MIDGDNVDYRFSVSHDGTIRVEILFANVSIKSYLELDEAEKLRTELTQVINKARKLR